MPVRPICSSGKSARRAATRSRRAETLVKAGVNESVSFTGRTSRNASDPSPEKKYCGSASRSCCCGGRASRLSHGLWYAAGSLIVAAADRTTERSCVRNCSSAASSEAMGSILPARSRACLSRLTRVRPFQASCPLSGPSGPLKSGPIRARLSWID